MKIRNIRFKISSCNLDRCLKDWCYIRIPIKIL